MKVIERTAFPLIKVSTKGKNTRPLQLDISFDSPQHHGVEGVVMVTDTIKVNEINHVSACTVKHFNPRLTKLCFLTH